MNKIKSVGMNTLYVYVAAVAVVGLTELTLDTIDYFKERNARQK